MDFSLPTQKPDITNPSKEGWLDKQSNFWKTYRKRWIVLQGQQLYSFKEENIYENPTAIFDLRIFTEVKPSEDGKTGQFELLSKTDSRLFCASSEKGMEDWIKNIRLSFTSATKVKKTKKQNSKTDRKNKNIPKEKSRRARTPNLPRIKINDTNTKRNGKRASMRVKTKQTGNEPRARSLSFAAMRPKSKSLKICPSWMKSILNDSSSITKSQQPRNTASALYGRKKGIRKYISQSNHNSSNDIPCAILDSTTVLSAGTAMVKSESWDGYDDMSTSFSLSMLEHIKQNKVTDNALYMYSVQFKSRPFGLTLNKYNLKSKIGAMVAVNHNISGQKLITEGSRLISINGENCEKYKFKKIEEICRTSTLPTIIKFVKSDLPFSFGHQSSASDTDTIPKKRGFFSLNKRKSMISLTKKSNSFHIGGHSICVLPSQTHVHSRSALALDANIESLFAEQSFEEDFKDEKSSMELMEKLNGIDFIKKAKEFEKERDWYNCVQCYDTGIFELEKSLMPLTAANILNYNQEQYCQRIIDGYCRKLNNLQRVHAKAIAKHERLTESPKYTNRTKKMDVPFFEHSTFHTSDEQKEKEADMEGNFNFEHMKEEELNMREKSFKSYFYSVIANAKMADKYYKSFVENAFNDLEIMIEFARVEDKNESLEMLCHDCKMNKMHARQLLRRLSQLSLSNSVFEKWFTTHNMSKYYEMMLNAGVVTFGMFEKTFVCCSDFVEYLGVQENETEGNFIWKNVPLKRNKNQKKNIRKKKNKKK